MKSYIIAAACALFVACSAQSTPDAPAPESYAKLDALLPTLTGENVWDMVEGSSHLTFKAVHNSREFVGEFGVFQTTIRLDPDAPETGEIHVVVDMSSVDAKDGDRNANLPRPEWFNTAAFPYAQFNSSQIEALGGGNFQALGELSIKDMSQPATLRFSLVVDGNAATAIGGVEISRRDFNVGTGSDFETEDWVKFPVDVMFEIKAEK